MQLFRDMITADVDANVVFHHEAPMQGGRLGFWHGWGPSEGESYPGRTEPKSPGRMTHGEGKERPDTQTHTHSTSHVFWLNSWDKISLPCNDF